MTTPAEEHRLVAGRFTEAVLGVHDGGWDAPAPVEGWVARDVVRHLMEWFPAFLEGGAGMEPVEDLMRSSGQYGARVEVPDDADVQTRMLAFIGRRP
ncbi:MAG: maleylpyruvate isomerase N-terminal domain-containing protein [Pseudonocardiaceae bacterium]